VCQKIFGVRCEKQKHIIWIYYEYASSKMFEKLLNSFFFGFSLFHQRDVFSTELFIFYKFTYFRKYIYNFYSFFRIFRPCFHPSWAMKQSGKRKSASRILKS
jgi:hypothetical protein